MVELRKRDAGLQLAIKAAGSVHALARLLGVSRPAVSQWTRVPVHHILQVESRTGVPREKLWPDLYRRSRKRG
jgi:DNA-binding transcriptional regulator YdaS (Cro superfamily)